MEISDLTVSMENASLETGGGRDNVLNDRTNQILNPQQRIDSKARSTSSTTISTSPLCNMNIDTNTSKESSAISTSSLCNMNIDMGTGTPKKSNVAKRKMTSILLPIRDGKKSNTPEGQVRWKGVTPLEWIDSLKAKTDSMAMVEGDDEDLLSPFFDREENKRMLPTRTPVNSPNLPTTSEAVGATNIAYTDAAFFSPMVVESGNNINHSPSSTSVEQGSPIVTMASPYPQQQQHQHQQQPQQMPAYFDMSYLHQTPLTERMRVLILEVESHVSFPKVSLTYYRTHNHFKYSVWYIRSTFPSPCIQLDMLYYETIQKLEGILELEQKLVTEDEQETEDNHFYRQQQQHQEHSTIQLARSASMISSSSASSFDSFGGVSGPTLSPASSKRIDEYMTTWLRENWVNPYPDEFILVSLADEVGTSRAAISEWLVHARNSRWRPSMTKALELNRPAEYLLEDSIHIFDGKAVRTIEYSIL